MCLYTCTYSSSVQSDAPYGRVRSGIVYVAAPVLDDDPLYRLWTLPRLRGETGRGLPGTGGRGRVGVKAKHLGCMWLSNVGWITDG